MMRPFLTILIAWCALLAAVAVPARAEAFYVAGSGGVPLAVTVAGPEGGPEILFIHGLGLGGDSFSTQMESDLAERFRMVTFDLRGNNIWLTTEATTKLLPADPEEKPWYYKEWISNHASLDAVSDPHRTWVDSVASFSLVMD